MPWRVEYKKLGDIGEFLGGLTGKSKDDFKDGNAKFITYVNVYNNPALRLDLNDTVRIGEDEKQRKREFYKMSKEQAYDILQNIASINGLERNLHLIEEPVDEASEVDEKASYSCSSVLGEKIKSVFNNFMDKLNEFPDIEVIIKKSYYCLNYKEERITDILFFKNKFTVILNSSKLADSSRLEELPESNNWGQMDSQIKVLNQEDVDYVLKLLSDSFHFEK